MKKIIDEHGRVFGKISIIDVLVIVIVIMIGTGLYVKYNVLDITSKSAGTTTITYTANIYGVRDFTVNAIKVGDMLYDKNNSGGYTIGTITGVQVSAAKKTAETLDGKLVLGNYIGYDDVTITVASNGVTSEGRYLVNKTYELNANSIRTFYTKYCSFDATITEIK